MMHSPFIISAMDYITMKRLSVRDGYLALDSLDIHYPWFKQAMDSMIFIGTPEDPTVTEVFEAWKGYIMKKYGEDYYFFAKELLRLLLNWDEDQEGDSVFVLLKDRGISREDYGNFVKDIPEV